MRLRPSHAILALCLLLAAGCGDDGSDAKTGGGGKGGAAKDAAKTTPEAGSPAASEEKSGISSFADTPELEECMTAAGFAEDAPSTGAIKAWRHPSGARVAIGSDEAVTTGIAAEIGTPDAPADVNGTAVLAGPQEQRDAAATCLG